jgi:hypothetical protein
MNVTSRSLLKARLLLSTASVTFAALSTPAPAHVVFSTLGPGNSYGPGALGIYGSAASVVPFPQSWASAFIPSGDFMLNQIDVGITSSRGTPIILSLDHASHGLPGGTIESWTLTNLSPVGSGAVETVRPVSPLPLVSGAEYWLAVMPGASDTAANWGLSNTVPIASPPNAVNYLGTNGAWAFDTTDQFPPAAFAVLGSVIPEPSTWAMTLLGFAGLGFVGCRQTRRATSQAA